MQLCAGNLFSLEVPLEVQYLAACQRNSDFHAERVLDTPEEVARIAALCRASMIVSDALDAFDEWQKGK